MSNTEYENKLEAQVFNLEETIKTMDKHKAVIDRYILDLEARNKYLEREILAHKQSLAQTNDMIGRLVSGE